MVRPLPRPCGYTVTGFQANQWSDQLPRPYDYTSESKNQKIPYKTGRLRALHRTKAYQVPKPILLHQLAMVPPHAYHGWTTSQVYASNIPPVTWVRLSSTRRYRTAAGRFNTAAGLFNTAEDADDDPPWTSSILEALQSEVSHV